MLSFRNVILVSFIALGFLSFIACGPSSFYVTKEFLLGFVLRQPLVQLMAALESFHTDSVNTPLVKDSTELREPICYTFQALLALSTLQENDAWSDIYANRLGNIIHNTEHMCPPSEKAVLEELLADYRTKAVTETGSRRRHALKSGIESLRYIKGKTWALAEHSGIANRLQ